LAGIPNGAHRLGFAPPGKNRGRPSSLRWGWQRAGVLCGIKSNYNGYHFLDPSGEALYNSTILMYFLEKLCRFKQIPEFLIDLKLKTDISWVRRLTDSNPDSTRELVDQLSIENQLPYSKMQLRDKFDMPQFFDKSFYPISFFYLGMLTRRDDFFMCLPNLNMKTIFSDYFNEIHKVNTGTLYGEMMSSFAQLATVKSHLYFSHS